MMKIENNSINRSSSDTNVNFNQTKNALTILTCQYRHNLRGLSISGGRKCASSERLNDGMDMHDSIKFNTAYYEFLNNLKTFDIKKSISFTATSNSTSSSTSSICSLLANTAHETVRKVVRFADVNGLELVTIRYFDRSTDSLQVDAADKLLTPYVYVTSSNKKAICKSLFSGPFVATFQMPRFLNNFHSLLNQQKVILESVGTFEGTVSGTIAVREMGCVDKQVFVRESHDDWLSHTDHQALYINDSCDGESSRFSFTIFIRQESRHISSLHLAICYRTNNDEYWDNHFGCNYVFLVPFTPDLHVRIPRLRK